MKLLLTGDTQVLARAGKLLGGSLEKYQAQTDSLRLLDQLQQLHTGWMARVETTHPRPVHTHEYTIINTHPLCGNSRFYWYLWLHFVYRLYSYGINSRY